MIGEANKNKGRAIVTLALLIASSLTIAMNVHAWAESLGTWTSTTAYPTISQLQSCAVSSGFIYCVAGTTPSGVTNAVFYDAISSTLDQNLATIQNSITLIQTTLGSIQASITSSQTAITTAISNSQTAIINAITSSQTAIINAIIASHTTLQVHASSPTQTIGTTSSSTVHIQVSRGDSGVAVTGATVSATFISATTGGTWTIGAITDLGGGTYSIVVTPASATSAGGTAVFRIATTVTISGVTYNGSTLATVTVVALPTVSVV